MRMRELAKLCNVSVSTVSKAFSGAQDVSAETRDLIFSVARENGCYGRFSKQKYDKKAVALICPELDSDYYTGYVIRLQKLIEKNGGIAIVCSYNFDFARQEELVEYCASYLNADGIIVFNLKNPLKKGYDLPIVNLFSHVKGDLDQIAVDFSVSSEEAVKALYEKGHRRFFFIGEALTVGRCQLFKTAASALPGTEFASFNSPSNRFESAGKEGVEQMLEKMPHATAIICAYDNIAFGAVKELKRRGYSVPRDFSVVGGDNISMCQYMDSPLSSVDTSPDEICDLAWELLEKRLKNNLLRGTKSVTINGRFIMRESVGTARDDRN